MDDEVTMLGLVGLHVVGAPVVDAVKLVVVGQVVPRGVHPPLAPRVLVQQLDVLQSLGAVQVLLASREGSASGRQAAFRYPAIAGAASMTDCCQGILKGE